MTAPGWHPDPTRRHQLRYWDGLTWSASVSDAGVVSTDDPHAPGPGGWGGSAAPMPMGALPVGGVPAGAPKASHKGLWIVLGIVGAVVLLGIIAIVAVIAYAVANPRLDTAALERSIGSSLTRSLGEEVTVSCPDSVPRKQGDTFECTATLASDGTTAAVEVYQEDNSGNVTFQLAG